MKRWGLALGGGGLKGAVHIGVLQVLGEERIVPRFIAGTSAGSIIAALYASGIGPRGIKKIALDLKAGDYIDYNYSGFVAFLASLAALRPSLPSGFVKGDKFYRLMLRLTEEKRLSDCPLPIAITAVDLDLGVPVVFTNLDFELEDGSIVITDATLAEAVRASISIPGVFVPASVKGRHLVDGGVCDILPLRLVRAMGAEAVIGVDLENQRYHTPARGVVSIITRTLDIMMEHSSELAENLLADLVIAPQIGSTKLTDYEKIPELIRCGERAARDNLRAIRSVVGQ